jgi:hypothetical protein
MLMAWAQQGGGTMVQPSRRLFRGLAAMSSGAQIPGCEAAAER